MIPLTYARLAAIDQSPARCMLLEVYHDSGGNVSWAVSPLCTVAAEVTYKPRCYERATSWPVGVRLA
jgi:hypothetical protein